MKKARKPYNRLQQASAVFMILALLWLTVSAPFVYASQQQWAKQHKAAGTATLLDNNEEESSNSFGNTTEEKNTNASSSFSEEYLHHHHHTEAYFGAVTSQYHDCGNAAAYVAFHGELLVPPPNLA